MPVDRCGKRYGKRRQNVCRRRAGHIGQHGPRLSVREQARSLSAPRRRQR